MRPLDTLATAPRQIAIMTESEFEIHLDYTEAEFVRFQALETERQRALRRRRERTTASQPYWGSWSPPFVFGAAVSILVSLLAVLSGAVIPRAGNVIAVLAFAAFYAGVWTPSMTAWFSRASRSKEDFVRFKSEYANYRLSVTDTGLWLSNEYGLRSFMPYSYFHSASIMDTLLVLWMKTEKSLALPLRLLTSEQQARLVELVGAKAPRAS